jgi:hypothetical protein
MNETKVVEAPETLGSTTRTDAWWLEPFLVALGFTAFIVYATWRAFEFQFFEWGPYLSPFYSPNLAHIFTWWKWSPALLILWVPAGFRATCYYYRKAYYRAYFLDPPGCGVGHWGGDNYRGENSFPFLLQNLHRYFLYFAIIVLGILWYDAILAFKFTDGTHVGVGTVIMVVNCLLLTNYTFGCHALRHIVGGRLDCFSCPSARPQFGLWKLVTKLNEHHMLWAWLSLFSVGLTDFYIRCLSAGLLTDYRLF